MSALRLYFLGTLDIRHDDRPLDKPPTAKSQSLLAYLILHRDRVVSREELLEKVWEYPNASGVETRTVDNYVVRLRQKVEPDPQSPRVVLTVRGKGYRFGWEG